MTCLAVSWALFAPVESTASPAASIDPGLQIVLHGLGPREKIPVIVRFVPKLDRSRFQDKDKGLRRARLVSALKAQAATSRNAVAHILASPAVSGRATLWAINGVAITADAGVIRALAGHPGVESMYMDIPVDEPGGGEAPGPIPEWNLDAIGAPALWAMGYSGAGVVVASMDSGVDADHPDLAARFRGGSNSWFDPNGEHSSPYDRTGHGTRTMGPIVGGSAGGTALGVAPDAEWIAVKIFSDAGSASLSAIHQGFQWLLDPDGNPQTDDVPDVVNNSWSLGNVGGCNLEFEQDIQILKAAQIAVVFSGGNYGPTIGSSVSPANNPGGFAVGAADDLGLIAGFSSNGPSPCDGSIYPELVAPGVGVRTTDLSFGALSDPYIISSGTSLAAPHVTGAMALLLSAHPDATVAQLEQGLIDTAVDGGATTGPDNTYGNGSIDVVAAESWVANPPGPVCTDADGDGFFAEAVCGGQPDCNDFDAGINPAACDIKGDGIDQDCDGVDRTKGKACPGPDGGGAETVGVEGTGRTCSDGLDNDGNGLFDCADPNCAKNRSCR